MSSMYGNMGATGSNVGNRIPKGYELGQVSNFSPEQMQLFKSMFSQVGQGSFTSKLASGDQDIFNQIEAPALRQFSELQGNLSSRFSGMGSLGSRRSSGFQNSINAAGSNFAQDLQGRRQSLQSDAIRDLMSMSTQLLGQRPQENFLTEKQKPFWQQLLMGLSGGAGKGIGSALGGMF